MMVVTINASVVNAASTDEGNPTVITLISGSTMSGSAAGIFAEGETDHYFKFSLGSSSSYPDVMAVYLTNSKTKNDDYLLFACLCSGWNI